MSRLPRRAARGLTFALLAGLCLCAAQAGAEEWFDAYEAGLRLLKSGRGAAAAERFERAIRLQPVPGRNVLTYGTNRLAAYHPYLRLAEACLQAGDATRARAALARSRERAVEPADEREFLAARAQELETRLAATQSTPSPPLTTAATTTAPQPPVATLAPTAAPTALPVAVATPLVADLVTGTLELHTTPEGAAVAIDGRASGATPLVVDLPVGRHEVALTRPGTAEQRFAVRVDAGHRTNETRALIATAGASPTSPVPSLSPAQAPPTPAPDGALIVYTRPPGSTIYVDDEPLGRTDPMTGRFVKTGLPAGAHAVRVTAPGHDDASTTVVVSGAAPVTWHATLSASSPANPLARFALPAVVSLVGAFGLWRFTRRRRRSAASEATTTRFDLTAQPTLHQPRGTTPGPTRVRSAPPAAARADQGGPSRTAATEQLASHALLELVEASPVSEVGDGEAFGEYRLLELLGRGGMATVHKAERHGELIALKRPLAAFLEEPEFLQRFAREAEIGRTLHHPNIVRIVERGTVGPTPYFTMELIAGETLQARLRREGRLAPRAATRVVLQIAEALDYAHLKGVVHRDLKPSNVMLLDDGTVKVMDYGIARARRFDGLTLTGHFLGTPEYVAPETAEGHGSDARSDLYTLGVIFYELLTGRRPFVADTPFAVLRKHCSEAPVPPSQRTADCPAELEAVVLRLMAKNPDERHPGAEELLIELRDYLNRAA